MKMDDFERKLRRQPLRQVPSEWRGEILSAAQTVLRPTPDASFLSTLNHQLSTLLWPHPKAWAGLAAVWVFIFIVNFSIRDKTPMVAEKAVPPSPEVIAELRQQQRMLAELIGANQPREAEPVRFLPQPQSECVEIMAT
jgi:hypothetical protein